jgi:hypothetical protein
MNVNDPNSGDDTLNSHYQQRKQQHKMPAAVAQVIQQHAQQATVGHTQQTKRSWLLKPPIWASTFAACLVIVISIYFMPLEANFETEADYLPAAPALSRPTPRTSQPKATAKADAQVFDEFSPGILAEQDSMRMAKKQPYQAAKKPQAMQESFNYADADMTDRAQTIAVSGARISSSANAMDEIAQRVARQTVAQIQALEGTQHKQQAKQRQAVDCDGQILLVDIKHLNNIKVNDWVRLYWGGSDQLLFVEKLKQKPKNCNDPTNIK